MSKRYKLYVLAPIALLIISLLFIPKIILGTSLTGGTTIEVTTANVVSAKSITYSIDKIIPGTTVAVTKIAGINHVSFTMLPDPNITSGSQYFLELSGNYSDYSQATANVSLIEDKLKLDPTNSTLISQLKANESASSSLIKNMGSNIALELSAFSKFINISNYKYNSSNATDIMNVGTHANDNATKAYKTKVVSDVKGVVPFTSYSYKSITPTLGKYFLNDVINIILAAFVIIAIVVFIIFRTPIPALAIIFGAANDIIIALGGMGAFHITMGVASVGGILMLIGYAIDTEVLSSIRVLKRTEGSNEERAFESMKTGMTMTSAAIITFAVLFIVSYITFIPTYIEISGVVLFGLIGDLFTAWLGNTVMVLWYKNRRDLR